MDCPKCGEQMEQVVFHDIEVDRCSKCRGIWFDEFEKEDILEQGGAEVIDDGDDRVGHIFNRDRYTCPRCKGEMIRMVDAEQPHIWYEQCGGCRGTFFDAGEFRDLATHTLADVVKRWFTKERR
jgi:Zn-finger nucleic acid-binding protein